MDAPVAAIDIGTNTALCLVARRGPGGGLEVLDDACATARLGAGLARTGKLDDVAVERTLDLLEAQLRRARDLGVERVRAVGTAVLRRAADAERFLVACRERLDLEVEVIAPEEEARIGHLAVRGDGGADTIVLDVGGGSTELVTDAGESCLSAPVGAVVLTERFLGLEGGAPVEEGGFGALIAAVAQALAPFPAGAAAGREVVLIGGTASNLACLELGASAFDPGLAEGAVLPPDAAARWASRLAGLPVGERAALPIEADRAEILPAGLACVAGALSRLEAATTRVTGKGLRYGVAAGMLAQE